MAPKAPLHRSPVGAQGAASQAPALALRGPVLVGGACRYGGQLQASLVREVAALWTLPQARPSPRCPLYSCQGPLGLPSLGTLQLEPQPHHLPQPWAWCLGRAPSSHRERGPGKVLARAADGGLVGAVQGTGWHCDGGRPRARAPQVLCVGPMPAWAWAPCMATGPSNPQGENQEGGRAAEPGPSRPR